MKTGLLPFIALMASVASAATPEETLFEIRHRDIQSVLGVHHVGVCERSPTLLIEPRPTNDTERAFGRFGMANFKVYGTELARAYGRRCPQAERVQLAITPLPQNHGCREAGDCFLEVVKEGEDWRLLDDQLVMSVPMSPVNNADDLTELLAAGRFDLLDAYSGYANGAFNYYFVAFHIALSRHCERHIRQPVGRVLNPDTEVRNGAGTLLRVERGANLEIRIERDHAADFDRRYAPAMFWAGGVWLRRLRNPLGAIQVLDDFDRRVERLVAGACTDDRVQTVQHNMLAFSRGQPPLTGRYTTTKQRGQPPLGGGPSAPAFTQAYLQERPLKLAALTAAQAQHRAQARAELMVRQLPFAAIDNTAELDQAFQSLMRELMNAWAPEQQHVVRGRDGQYPPEYMAMAQQAGLLQARIAQAYQQRRLELMRAANRPGRRP